MIYIIVSTLFLYVGPISALRCQFPPGYDQCIDYEFEEIRISSMSPFRMIISKEPNGNDEYDYFCACDSECYIYDDCCANVNHSKPEKKPPVKDMSCIQVMGSSLPVLAIDSCPDSYSNAGIEAKCRSKELNVSHLYEHFLVYSMSSEVLYRNVYCAICNGDTQRLASFPVNMTCNKADSNSSITSFDQQWFYEKENQTWKYGNTSIKCTIQQNGHILGIKNGNIKARPCHRRIDTCDHSWNDTNGEVAQMCRSYTSHVYALDNNFMYKNKDCATCNYVEDVFCTSLGSVDRRKDVFSFRTLLDIRFDQCEPDSGQMYDEVLKTCVKYKVPRSSLSRSTNRIHMFSLDSNDSTSKAELCKTVTFPMNSFVELNRSFVYINSTKTYYSETKFHLNAHDGSVDVCVEEFHALPKIEDTIQKILSYFCLIFSIVCLILQLLVYLLIPRLRTVPGKILMSLSFSLLMAHISFVSMPLIEVHRKNSACVIDALLTHYFFLCSFFWMNVMSFDIYTVFGRFQRKQRGSSFLKYSLYAWLTPVVIVLVAMGNEYLIDYNRYQPLYGVHNCWIGQRNALLYFFVIPLTIIVMLNVVLFAMTTRELIATKKLTKTIAKKEETIRFKLYLKIAMLMGLTWIFGVVATFTGSLILWYPFIVLNGLQGVFIFFTFAFKRDNFDSLKTMVKKDKSVATTETGISEK